MMEKQAYYCEHCGKFLSEEEGSLGTVAARLDQKGFITKLPILQTGTDHFVFFCSKECWKTWLMEHSTEESRKDAQERVDKMRADMKKDQDLSKHIRK